MLCIGQILDIKPNLSVIIVSQDGIGLLCKILQDMGSFDLVEHVVRLLDRLAGDNANAVINNNTLFYLAQILEFFDFNQQKNVLKLMNILIKNITGRQGYENFVIPITKYLSNIIKYNEDSKSKQTMEMGSNLLATICELLPTIYGTRSEDMGVIKSRIEEIVTNDMIENIIEALSIATNSDIALTPSSWINIIRILRFTCKYSDKICKQVISFGILNLLQMLLTAEKRMVMNTEVDFIKSEGTNESEDIIGEGSVILLDAILPHKSLLDEYFKDKSAEYLIEAAKEKILKDQEIYLEKLWETILPRTMQIFETTESAKIKLYCLQIIDKIIAMCSPKVIAQIMSPKNTAQFLYENLTSEELLYVCFGMKILDMVLQRLSQLNSLHLKYIKKEGVIEILRLLQDHNYFNKKFITAINNNFISIHDSYIKYFRSFNIEAKLIKSSNSFTEGFIEYVKNKASKMLVYSKTFETSKEFKEAEVEYEKYKKVVVDLEKLLKAGNDGTQKEWGIAFKSIAELVPLLTAYEARSSAIFTNLYNALCILPTEYLKNSSLTEESKEEILGMKLKSIASKNSEDLKQIAMRQNTFMQVFNDNNTMIGLINKLHETLGNIEKYLDETRNDAPYSNIMEEKIRVMIVYVPKGKELTSNDMKRLKISTDKESEDLKTSTAKKQHELFETIHTLTFAVDKRDTFKDLTNFLRARVKTTENIAELKGEQYLYLIRQQEDLKKMLERDSCFEDFLKDQEEMLASEEAVHTLNKSHIKDSSDTQFSFKYFCGSNEIKNKNQSIIETTLRLENRRADIPRDVQGVIAFHFHEKSKRILKKLKEVAVESESSIEGKEYLFRNLGAYEQQALVLCKVILGFNISQINCKDSIAILKLLKFLYYKIKTLSMINPSFSSITDKTFINAKFEGLLKKKFQTMSAVVSGAPNWGRNLFYTLAFLISEKTRLLHFKFATMNRERRLSALMQALRGTKLELKIPQKRIKVKISRSSILKSGMSLMLAPSQKDCLMEFDFENEIGSGLGPTMEFYALSALELKGIKHLWRVMDDGSLFPNATNTKFEIEQKCFQYMGWLVGRSINDKRLIDLPFAEVFWEMVLEHTLTLIDIVKIDKTKGIFLLELDQLRKKKEEIEKNPLLTPTQKANHIHSLKLKNNMKIENLGLTFVLQGYDSIELKPNGSNIALTIDNLSEYLSLTAYYTLNKTVSLQVNAFRNGFSLVLPVDTLQFFKPSEMEEIICGNKAEKWDTKILTESILPVHGYYKDSPQYCYFIEYLITLQRDKQRLFLKYVTGSPRLPNGGFIELAPKMTIAKRITPEGDHPDLYLPSVMTCQNYLKIPEYSSYAILKDKFDYALTEGQNSFTLS